MDDFRQEFSLESLTRSPFRPYTSPSKRPSSPTKSGFPLSRFPTTPRADFICRVCIAVVRDPRECVECGLLLCGQCWESTGRLERRGIGALFVYRERDYCCPGCNRYCPTREPSRLLRRLILSLPIQCKHAPCTQLLPLSDLKCHQRLCPFKTMHCSNYVCCSSTGKRESFLKVSVVLSEHSRETTVFVCSDRCKKTVLLEALIRRNEIEKAVQEFHEKMRST